MRGAIGRHDEVFQVSFEGKVCAPFTNGRRLKMMRRIDFSLRFPAMDCDIDRILSYISCYSATTDMKEAADYRFTRLIKELQDVLHGEAARLKEGSIRS